MLDFDLVNDWKSQTVISNSVKMGLRKMPYAFTENGVAMHLFLTAAKVSIYFELPY